LVFGGKRFQLINGSLVTASTLLFTHRSLHWLMVFASMRVHVHQIKETVRSAAGFVCGPVALLLVSFLSIDLAVRKLQGLDDQSIVQRSLQLFSNVAYFGAGKEQPAAAQVLFALLFHLILTNIMIALALNTNERLKFNRKAVDYKLKVGFILFVEHLLSSLRPPASSACPHYLHILRYT
jgi:hypothetical protein